MAITLGKDATVSVGSSVVGVRNVTFSSSARTIDVEAYGSRLVEVYQTGCDGSLSMELNDDSSISTIAFALNSGAQVAVSGSPGGWTFPAVITSLSSTASVDGVVTFQVEAKLTRSGLR